MTAAAACHIATCRKHSFRAMNETDYRFMGEALALGEKALFRGEFPVGCVVVEKGRVVAEGFRNHTFGPDANELDHAEIVALRSLARKSKRLPLADAAIYCTMEPCLMCYGAILLAGIRRIVYAYEDVMGGGTGIDAAHLSPLYRKSGASVVAGVRRRESRALFRRFFEKPENEYWRGSLLAAYTLGGSAGAGD